MIVESQPTSQDLVFETGGFWLHRNLRQFFTSVIFIANLRQLECNLVSLRLHLLLLWPRAQAAIIHSSIYLQQIAFAQPKHFESSRRRTVTFNARNVRTIRMTRNVHIIDRSDEV